MNAFISLNHMKRCELFLVLLAIVPWMENVEMTCPDLDCGGGSHFSAVNKGGKGENICFSKAEEGSCYFQSNLAADSSKRRASSVVGSDCVVDIEKGVDEVEISYGTMERECRICMLSLDLESGIAIELGCSCKKELAAVHRHCAEQWFKSKGNKVCEICKSIAQNVVPNNIKSRQQSLEVLLILNKCSLNASI